jgi:Asp-tRNA(Asn)/Glu-tRNA(Gln) amidotransferase A subunit family amidase
MTSDTIGLYARSIEDLELLSSVFKLADDEPIPALRFQVKAAKIAFVKTSVWPKAGPGTRNAWAKAQEILSKHGANVEEIELPECFAKVPDWHTNIIAGEGRVSFLGSESYQLPIVIFVQTPVNLRLDYLLSKDKLNKLLHGYVENVTKLSRKEQLESYDSVAALRPVWDSIAQKYDAVITPSAIDEAPIGRCTGDPVRNLPNMSSYNLLELRMNTVLLCYLDRFASTFAQPTWFCRGERHAYWFDSGWTPVL